MTTPLGAVVSRPVHVIDEGLHAGKIDPPKEALCGARVVGFYVTKRSAALGAKRSLCPRCLAVMDRAGAPRDGGAS